MPPGLVLPGLVLPGLIQYSLVQYGLVSGLVLSGLVQSDLVQCGLVSGLVQPGLVLSSLLLVGIYFFPVTNKYFIKKSKALAPSLSSVKKKTIVGKSIFGAYTFNTFNRWPHL